MIFAVIKRLSVVSASQLKLVRSLRQKKYRDLHNLFMAEGDKIVLELVKSHRKREVRPVIPGEGVCVRQLIATETWIKSHWDDLDGSGIPVTGASPAELRKMSSLVTPQPVIALVSIPEATEAGYLPGQVVLAFESIRDPGNLGTIMRTADWFGIGHMICSPDSVDVFNPKVVQSTMGAIARIRVHYLDIGELLRQPKTRNRSVYGTFLQGESIYETILDPQPIILFGNESRGISGDYEPYLDKKISIPPFSAGGNGSESLNLASAVAIVCSEIRRRSL